MNLIFYINIFFLAFLFIFIISILKNEMHFLKNNFRYAINYHLTFLGVIILLKIICLDIEKIQYIMVIGLILFFIFLKIILNPKKKLPLEKCYPKFSIIYYLIMIIATIIAAELKNNAVGLIILFHMMYIGFCGRLKSGSL